MSDGNAQDRLQAWRAAAAKSAPGGDLDSLNWLTPDGIVVKPLYTAADTAGLPYADTLPGFAPFVRGPQPTMYAVRPWTIRQYAGFSTAEESNAFYRKALAAGGQGLAVERVGFLGGGKARVLADRPGAHRVHGGLRAAHEGCEAGQGVGVGQAGGVGRGVQRLDDDAVRGEPVQRVEIAPGGRLGRRGSPRLQPVLRIAVAHVILLIHKFVFTIFANAYDSNKG